MAEFLIGLTEARTLGREALFEKRGVAKAYRISPKYFEPYELIRSLDSKNFDSFFPIH
jgi:hypothetical protein